MLKFILLHLLKWTSIILLSLIGIGVGIFFLDFKHALTDDPKLNFIYTCLLTVGVIPVGALLLGGLALLKKAIIAHRVKRGEDVVSLEVVEAA
jgi:hypothetical protein